MRRNMSGKMKTSNRQQTERKNHSRLDISSYWETSTSQLSFRKSMMTGWSKNCNAKYIEDITWPRGGTNFILWCWDHLSLIRFAQRYFQHDKIKFVSPSGHVTFSLFYRYWWKSYIKHNFLNSFSKQQNGAIKVVTCRKMPATKM